VTPLDQGNVLIAVGVPRYGAQVAKNLMPIADLNSRAQTVILAARRELQPATGERERLEALLSARIGRSALEAWAALEQSLLRSSDNVRG
jgi:hypothetical protein